MTDQVRMISRTVFQNERVTVFRPGGPLEGVRGATVEVGDSFTTDLAHAQDLDRQKFAYPENPADLDGEIAAPTPHYSVSATAFAPGRVERSPVVPLAAATSPIPAIVDPVAHPVTTDTAPAAANAAVQAPHHDRTGRATKRPAV